MAAITDLYRYPIKGLSPEPLASMTLSVEQGLPFDRDYALALGTTSFDPAAPQPLDKGFFLMLRNNEALAALRTRLDPGTHRLTIEHATRDAFSADLSTQAGPAPRRRRSSRITSERRPRAIRGWYGRRATSSPMRACSRR